MNPSVEEVADEGLKTPHQAQANGNGNPLSWVEVSAADPEPFAPAFSSYQEGQPSG